MPDVRVEPGVLNRSYPFCGDCTESKISRLTDLYRQLQVLQESFDEIRSSIVRGVIKAFISRKEQEGHRDKEEDKLFKCNSL